MKKVLFITALAVALVGCKTNTPEEDNNDSGGTFPSGGEVSSDSVIGSTDLADFDIAWSSVPLTNEPSDLAVLPDDGGDFLENWDAYNDGELTAISLEWSESGVTQTGTAKNVTVTIDGTDVVIVSTKKKIQYILSGACADGSIKIYSDYKFLLTLNGLTLTNPTGPAIDIEKGTTAEEDGSYPHKTAYIQLTDGTTNTLVDGTTYTTTDGEKPKACLFSEGQLVFSGAGTLNITGNYKHAICSNDYVRIRPGVQLNLTTSAGNGIHGSDYIIVGGGLTNIEVTSPSGKGLKADSIYIAGGKTTVLTSGTGEYDSDDADVSACAGVKADGLTIASGELYLKSTGAGGKGISVDGDLAINGGTVQIITSGGVYQYGSLDTKPKGIKADSSFVINGGNIKVRATGAKEGSEGIESKNTLAIHGGIVEVYTTDDALNATNDITIDGGYVYAYGSDNDGIDSNGTLHIGGGVVIASGTSTPESGFDCDENTFAITGGIAVGIGGDSSTPTANSCTQNSVLYKGSCAQGALITLTQNDAPVLSYTPEKTLTQMTLLLTTPELATGTTYALVSGGTLSGATTFHGLSIGGTLSGTTTSVTSFTPTSVVTQIGTNGGQGGNPGGQGGGGTPGGNPGGNPGGRP